MASRAPAADRRADPLRLSGVLLVVTAASLFGTIGTARVLGPDASSWSVGGMRLLVAVAALLAVASRFDGPRRSWTLVRRPESLLAGAGQAVFQVTFLTAVQLTGVAVGTLVAIGSAPLVTGLLARTVSTRWAVATGLGLVGLCLLVTGSADDVSWPGVLLALGAGVAYAVYTTSSSRLAAQAPAASVTAAGFVVAAGLLAPVLLLTDNGWVASREGLALLGYLSLVATALAYLLFVRGLMTVPAATAQTLGLAEPVVATALGLVVLDERLGAWGFLGATMVLAALVVLARAATVRA
jgi:DME family drug/metabolite transporter